MIILTIQYQVGGKRVSGAEGSTKILIQPIKIITPNTYSVNDSEKLFKAHRQSQVLVGSDKSVTCCARVTIFQPTFNPRSVDKIHRTSPPYVFPYIFQI